MGKFQKVYIEISDICGCECSFCPSPNMTKFGVMELGLYERILEQISGKTRAICLHILGDPLANLKLNKYLSLAFERGFSVDLVTTGKFLKRHDFATLCKAHQISFSLSAFLDKNAKFDVHYTKDLLEFCEFKNSIKSEIFVNFRVQKHMVNLAKFQDLISEFERFFGVEICTKFDEIDKFGSKNTKNSNRIRLGYKTFLNFKDYFEWKNPNSQISQKFCHGLSAQIGFKSSGVVVPCCIDAGAKINLGNIATQGLEQILDNSRARAILDGFKRGEAVEKLCQKCEYRAVLE